MSRKINIATASLSFLSISVAAGCIFLLGIVSFAPSQKIAHENLLIKVSHLYNMTTHITQSYKLGKILEDIVRKRISCYSNSPLQRSINCNVQYVGEIVRIGREKILSAPDMGNFMNNVGFCPIVYGVCMGEKGNTEECINLEARCIDGMYDSYWRGRPFNLKFAR